MLSICTIATENAPLNEMTNCTAAAASLKIFQGRVSAKFPLGPGMKNREGDTFEACFGEGPKIWLKTSVNLTGGAAGPKKSLGRLPLAWLFLARLQQRCSGQRAARGLT